MSKIDQSANIAHNATVDGNVEIAADVTVMYGAVVRGDCDGKIVIGARSNIQDLVCVHVPMHGQTVLANDVAVGHGAILHGCTIGEGTLIGMGAIVLDGAKIGRGCLIAAGAVVTGGADIPDNSLVMGVPARIVRETTEEDRKYIQSSIDEYMQIGRDMCERGLCQ
jgi:carbonic anhydrase/acetyltransferase-like protein (isoleucine patch superfamily)